MVQNTIKQADTIARLHAQVEVGTVTLKVANLANMVRFYTQLIGLKALSQSETRVVLGAGGRAIIILEAIANAQGPVHNSTGLFHAAILLPSRKALAIKIAQLAQAGWELGQGDHLVSEAFYLSDPEGNGLEIYRDRPRSEWKWKNGQVEMATLAVDVDGLFGELDDNDPALLDLTAPAGTKLGHTHLRVGHIPTAETFYRDVMGFDVVAKMPSALFVSAGGYHHHLGMNTWQSAGGKPAPDNAVGLRAYSVSLPDAAELERLTRQIEAAGVKVEREETSAWLHDPFQNKIELVLAESLQQG